MDQQFDLKRKSPPAKLKAHESNYTMSRKALANLVRENNSQYDDNLRSQIDRAEANLNKPNKIEATRSPVRFYQNPDQNQIRNRMELAKFDVFCDNWQKNNPIKQPVVDQQFRRPSKKIAEVDGLDLDYSLTDIRGADEELEDVSEDVEFDISSAQIARDKENTLPSGKLQPRIKPNDGVFRKKFFF